MNILFLCTGNSCRSILAEAIFNQLAPAGFLAMSAGSKPTGQVHPKALAELEKHGISPNGLCSKSWNNLPAKPDIVITLCASAAGETCPLYLGDLLRTHWGMPDPAGIKDEAESVLVFAKTFAVLQARIKDFLALPHKALLQDKTEFLKQLQAIGQKYADI